MQISMYQASVPQFIVMLQNLSAILKKAEHHAIQKKIDPCVLLASRLFPDMFHLIKQVQIATDQVRHGCARLAGVELLKLDDNEASFADLQARIAKTVAFIEKFQPAQIDGQEAREIKFSIGEWKFEFTGQQYLLTWIMPNFYFHLTTAYNLLRHNGIEIGKGDFLGG